jgi:hypothetical protein
MPTLEFRMHATTPANLRPIFDACVKQMGNPLSGGGISLVLGGMKPAHQTRRHLAGRNSPKGEIVSDSDGDTQIVSFKATEVLAWMVANKWVSMHDPDARLHTEQEVKPT